LRKGKKRKRIFHPEENPDPRSQRDFYKITTSERRSQATFQETDKSRLDPFGGTKPHL
jgi:hypothetical protein